MKQTSLTYTVSATFSHTEHIDMKEEGHNFERRLAHAVPPNVDDCYVTEFSVKCSAVGGTASGERKTSMSKAFEANYGRKVEPAAFMAQAAAAEIISANLVRHLASTPGVTVHGDAVVVSQHESDDLTEEVIKALKEKEASLQEALDGAKTVASNLKNALDEARRDQEKMVRALRTIVNDSLQIEQVWELAKHTLLDLGHDPHKLMRARHAKPTALPEGWDLTVGEHVCIKGPDGTYARLPETTRNDSTWGVTVRFVRALHEHLTKEQA